MKEDTGEREWVNRLRSGDKQAFELIFRKYREKVYYFAIRYYNSPDDAENVVQDVFIKLWNEREGLKAELSLNN
jgi:RNA polymerase sigma-70 factor (ECF subfamily)